MILCHKCAGVLSGKPQSPAIYRCGCISGWIRGSEPEVDEMEAIMRQIAEQWSRLDLYAKQGRDPDGPHAQEALKKIHALESAKIDPASH